jgi:hypothetical protein
MAVPLVIEISSSPAAPSKAPNSSRKLSLIVQYVSVHSILTTNQTGSQQYQHHKLFKNFNAMAPATCLRACHRSTQGSPIRAAMAAVELSAVKSQRSGVQLEPARRHWRKLLSYNVSHVHRTHSNPNQACRQRPTQ